MGKAIGMLSFCMRRRCTVLNCAVCMWITHTDNESRILSPDSSCQPACSTHGNSTHLMLTPSTLPPPHITHFLWTFKYMLAIDLSVVCVVKRFVVCPFRRLLQRNIDSLHVEGVCIRLGMASFLVLFVFTRRNKCSESFLVPTLPQSPTPIPVTLLSLSFGVLEVCFQQLIRSCWDHLFVLSERLNSFLATVTSA